MRRRALYPLVALVPAMLVAPAAHADDGELERLLNENIVTTASKMPETASEAPAVSSTLSADDLRRHGIRSIAEAINYLSLGMFAQSPLGAYFQPRGQSEAIGARGVALQSDDNADVLVLLDGHTINDGAGAVSTITEIGGMPVELIDHVEIILGPGSILYGGHAMLGVVNIVTRRAKAYEGFHAYADGNLAFKYNDIAALHRASDARGFTDETRDSNPSALTADANHWRDSQMGTRGRIALGYGHEFTFQGIPASVVAHVQYATDNGPGFAMGRIQQKREAEFVRSLPSAHLRLTFGNFELSARAIYETGHRIDYAFRTQQGYETSKNFTDDALFINGPARNEQRARRLNLDLSYRKKISPFFSVNGRIFADSSGVREWRLSYDGIRDGMRINGHPVDDGVTSVLDQYVTGLGVETQGVLDWFQNGTMTTLFGVWGQYQQNEASLDTTEMAHGATAREMGIAFGETAAAAYAQNVWHPTSNLTVNVGARLDRYTNERTSGQSVSPRAAITYSPWKGGVVKAIYSEAFRAPGTFEQFLHGQTITVLPASTLDPEKVRSGEAAVEHSFGSTRVRVGGFFAWWEDMLYTRVYSTANGPGDYSVIKNAQLEDQLVLNGDQAKKKEKFGSIKNYGINVGFDGHALGSRLTYGVNFTYAIARVTADRQLYPGFSGGGDPTKYVPGVSNDDLRLETAPEYFGNARIAYDFSGNLPTVAVASQLLGQRPMAEGYSGGFIQYKQVGPTTWEKATDSSGHDIRYVPYAPVQVWLRGTISGPIVHGLRYRVMGEYAFSSVGPYLVDWGKLDPSGHAPPPVLVPVDRVTAYAGLEYNLQ